jgi:dTDP-4-dehydrorhamnose reductase
VSRKIVVFGASGQLGVELCRAFDKRGWAVKRFDRQSLDICDAHRVESAIADSNPDVVVNSAAYNQVDVAEEEPLAAFQANALAVRSLAMACRQTGAQLVHYSTDYVFDGNKGSAYVETDMPHPLGAYGVSKLSGEHYAQAYLTAPLIIRTSGVFGPAGMFTPRGNFVELMLRLAREKRPIRVVADHVASPTYAPAMASRTADMIAHDLKGVFHLGGGEPISWFEFTKLIFESAGVNAPVHPTNEREYRTAARRPKYSALSNAKVEAAGIAPMPPLRSVVQDYLQARTQVSAHR